MTKDEEETFVYSNGGSEEDYITVNILDNGYACFDVFAKYGGPVDLDNEFNQKASVGLKHDEALRMAKWIVQKLEDN